MAASGMMVIFVIAVLTVGGHVKGWVPYLWKEWITSVDHKRIGVMYCLLAMVMLVPRLHRRDHDALAAGGRATSPVATCRRSTTTRSSPRTARS